MRLSSLAQTYRSMQRLREILLVLWRYGFNQFLQAARLARFLPLSRRLRNRGGFDGDLSVPARLRMALEDLGPTFVKLGQMLATRPDLVPPNFVEEFRKLQDDVPPFPFDEARKLIEEETGAYLDQSFASVEPIAMAAASMAQVHRARLPGGERVVVKVQRPGLERVISQDLSILYALVGVAERYIQEVKEANLRTIVDEFARTVRKELDFFREAANAERFRKTFEGFEGLVIPAVHWSLTTRRMLVLDEVVGEPVVSAAQVRALGFDPRRIATVTVRALLKQVFEDGVFHGDLHGGNLLVTPEGNVALLDFGAVGYLSMDLQENLGSLFLALVAQDYGFMAQAWLRMGAVDDSVDMAAFQRDLQDLIEPYYGRPLKDLAFGEILKESAQIAMRHRIRIPPELVLLARSTVAVEGLARSLDPDFLVLEEARPYASKLALRELDPRRQARGFLRSARDARDLVRGLPGQLGRILQKLVDGKLAIDFVHQGYEKLVDELDRSSNRITLGLIISALIIGSSLIVLSGKGPQLWQVPLFGILGFVIAGILGFGLAIAILRSGKF